MQNQQIENATRAMVEFARVLSTKPKRIVELCPGCQKPVSEGQKSHHWKYCEA